MKYLLTVISLFLITACASQKNNAENLTQTSLVDNQTLHISYEARSRVNFKTIQIIKNEVIYKTSKETKKFTISSNDKKAIHEALKEIDVTQIKYLKAPTNKRMFDGAMNSIIKIKKNNEEYSSANFDDGHPPKKLQNLIDILLKLIV